MAGSAKVAGRGRPLELAEPVAETVGQAAEDDLEEDRPASVVSDSEEENNPSETRGCSRPTL